MIVVQKYLIFLKTVSHFQENLDKEVGFNRILQSNCFLMQWV